MRFCGQGERKVAPRCSVEERKRRAEKLEKRKRFGLIKRAFQLLLAPLIISGAFTCYNTLSNQMKERKIKSQIIKTMPLYQEMREASVKIYVLTDDGNVIRGSGMIFEKDEEEVRIVSAKHLFDERKIIGVGVQNGNRVVSAEEVYVHPKKDMALVVVKDISIGRPLPPAGDAFLDKVACSISSPGMEEDVIMCGLYYIKPCVEGRGRCGGLFAPVFYGSSGGGVVDMGSGKLVGIVVALGPFDRWDAEVYLRAKKNEVPIILSTSTGATVIPITHINEDMVRVF